MLCMPLYIKAVFLLAPPHGTAMAARIGATKIQGFMKGYLVDSNLLSIRAEVNSKLLHHLQSQGVSLASHTNSQEERGGPTRLGVKALADGHYNYRAAFCFHPAVNAAEVCLALAVAAPAQSPLLFTWIWRLIQQAVCLAIPVAAQPVATAVHLRPGPGLAR